MKTLDELLLNMVEANASDLHLKAGSPPVMRVDGELQPLELRVPRTRKTTRLRS